MISPEIRYSSPLSEVWPAWLLLGLLLCLVIAEVLLTGNIRTSFRMLFTKLERVYGDSARSWVGRLCMDIFRAGTFTFVLYVSLYSRPPFSIMVFFEIVGILLGVELVKQLASALVSYTFNIRRSYLLFRTQYSALLTVVCVMLYPIALLDLNWGYLPVMRLLPTPLLAALLVILIMKLIQDFYNGPKSLAYIMVYLFTVELIPLAGAFLWIYQIV